MISVWELHLLCVHTHTHTVTLKRDSCMHAHTHKLYPHTGESSSCRGFVESSVQAEKQKMFLIFAYSIFFKTVALCCSKFTTCCTNSCRRGIQTILNNITLLWEELSVVFTKVVCTKSCWEKSLSEWVKEPRGAWGREGVCQTAFICGTVMTLFLQPPSKLSASCLLRAPSHFCPWNQSAGNELQPF